MIDRMPMNRIKCGLLHVFPARSCFEINWEKAFVSDDGFQEKQRVLQRNANVQFKIQNFTFSVQSQEKSFLQKSKFENVFFSSVLFLFCKNRYLKKIESFWKNRGS